MSYLKQISVLSLALAVVGCGGGGGSTPIGSNGGNQTVLAGSVRVEGQSLLGPESAVVGGVTTHVMSGNISTATLNDVNPTLGETEIFYTTDSQDILAMNGDGQGPVRTVINNMPTTAANLVPDPNGRYLYYIRSGNLQRADVRDGSVTPLVPGVTSFFVNGTGTKFLYLKNGTDELWTANINGSGQAFLRTVSTTVVPIGSANENIFLLRDGSAFRFIDISNGTMDAPGSFTDISIFWVSYSMSEKAAYIYGRFNAGSQNFVIFRTEMQSAPGLRVKKVYDSPTALSVFLGAAGPDQHFAGALLDGSRLKLFDIFGQQSFLGQFEATILGITWAPNRLSCPLIGPGTPFTTGMGALILSELGPRTPSVVMADAVTRSSITVTSLNDGPNGNPLYRIDCDNLKTLCFANGSGYVWKTVVSTATGLKGAVVSFDASTGLVSNMLTFTKRPTITRQGKGWKVEGEDLRDALTTSKPSVSSVVLR